MSAAGPRSVSLRRLRGAPAGRAVHAGRSRHGVELRVAHLPDCTKTYAVLTVRYGAVDTHLPDGTALPEGTAHFLEHRMFQKDGGDLFDVFDARGAWSNAFTTHTTTSYLFWCMSRLDDNLDTLLGALRTVEVTDEEVTRERAIIAQEIAGYDDDPSWRGYVLLMRALYRRHPVRVDIAGTATSIAGVDAALLRRVHRTWYHPRNQVLVVAGGAEPGRILDRLDAEPPPRRRSAVRRRAAVPEAPSVAKPLVRSRLEVGRPHVWLGLKDTPPGGRSRLVARQVLSTLALDVLFRDGGRAQARLYDEGLVDDSFHATYEAEADFGHALLYAEVEDVAAYRRAIRRALRDGAREGVTEEEVERVRRRLLGARLRVLNAPEPFAHWLLGTALERVPLDAGVEAVRRATAGSVAHRLRELAARPHAWTLIEPR